MRKPILVKILRGKFPELPATVVSDMTDAAFEAIIEAVARGDRVEIRKFGTFFSSSVGRRMLRNPSNREIIEIPPRRLPRFKASVQLREKVNSSGK